VLFVVFFVIVFFLTLNAFYWVPPAKFKDETTIKIERGSNLTQISKKLKEDGLIRSQFWFKSFVEIFGGDTAVKAGDYHFEKPISTPTLAWRLSIGKYSLNPIRVTVPEGLNVRQMSELFAGKFDLFDKEEFIKDALEGYLFPDTYFFLPNASSSGVIEKMNAQFGDVITALQEKIGNSGKSFEDVITMASLVEEEAHTKEDRRIISGILWKRLGLGIPLQVDASFSYVNGKNTYELTLVDLEVDSPYNTYRNLGLPPTPISNPGLDSILAALEPIDSDYLYYLSDLDGNIYYAEDFDGHQKNRELYLRK